MSNYRITLAPDVREVLAQSAIDATSLTLPGQLDRKLYEKVKKVIEAAGGTWNRKAGTHVFTSDPRERLGLALDTGGLVDERKALQQFFTPPELASAMADDVAPNERVLEPSAGDGAIAASARCRTRHVTCVELDTVLARSLAARGYEVIMGDFLMLKPDPMYHVVLMNPPFADGQEVDHVTHAMAFVRPGGRLRAVMSAGVRYRDDKKTRALRGVIECSNGSSIEPLPEGTFLAAGTAVHTVLLTWRKESK